MPIQYVLIIGTAIFGKRLFTDGSSEFARHKDPLAVLFHSHDFSRFCRLPRRLLCGDFFFSLCEITRPALH